MNFYDKIHELVRSFKETEEFKEYMRLKEEIVKDEKVYSMLKDFKEKQRLHQMEYINTGKMNEDTQKELENLYSIVIQNEESRKLLECEMRLDILLADMQKIMAEGIKDILEF
ncbi:MAG: YlbF family regulator [Clostridia bacterium]